MREILFRGKDVETDDWVKGQYARLFSDKGNRFHRIYPGYAESDCGDLYPDWYEVDPKTVGQFTGMTDKNGRQIFEGDVLALRAGRPHIVKFEDGSFVLTGTAVPIRHADKFEVIGNIHDNPELLEGGVENVKV